MSFTVKDLLNIELAPALGCTELAAIALGAAAAASPLPDKEVNSIEVWADSGIYENGFSAVIPETDGLCGINMALVLGALGGDPALKLEVLNPINDKTVTQAQNFLQESKVKVNLLPDQKGLYIKTLVQMEPKQAAH